MLPVQRWVASARDRQALLWVLAVVAYGVGDSATTYLGLGSPTAVEGGPVAGPVMSTVGFEGLLAIKLVFFATFYGLWSVLRTPGRVAIPLAITTAGVLVTVWNALVLLA